MKSRNVLMKPVLVFSLTLASPYASAANLSVGCSHLSGFVACPPNVAIGSSSDSFVGTDKILWTDGSISGTALESCPAPIAPTAINIADTPGEPIMPNPLEETEGVAESVGETNDTIVINDPEPSFPTNQPSVPSETEEFTSSSANYPDPYGGLFFPPNTEILVHVLDSASGHNANWVFYDGLTDVPYTLTVTDTGSVKVFDSKDDFADYVINDWKQGEFGSLSGDDSFENTYDPIKDDTTKELERRVKSREHAINSINIDGVDPFDNGLRFGNEEPSLADALNDHQAALESYQNELERRAEIAKDYTDPITGSAGYSLPGDGSKLRVDYYDDVTTTKSEVSPFIKGSVEAIKAKDIDKMKVHSVRNEVQGVIAPS